MKKPEPVLLAMSILAGLQFLFAGAAASTLLSGLPYVALICVVGNLAVAAAQTGIQFYVRGQVTPNEVVVTRVSGDGTVVAGEASPLPTGTPVETASEVLRE